MAYSAPYQTVGLLLVDKGCDVYHRSSGSGQKAQKTCAESVSCWDFYSGGNPHSLPATLELGSLCYKGKRIHLLALTSLSKGRRGHVLVFLL